MPSMPVLRPPFLAIAACLAVAVTLRVDVVSAQEPPAWAYPVNPPDFKPRVDDGTPRRVPDSTAGYTVTQLRDLFAAPVWHPDEHPPLPPIVAQGRKPAVFACGVCHRADGPGGPENANIAGLPAAYIVQQMADYKSGARTTAMPDRAPQKNMIALSKAITDEEVQAAAQYFSALKPRQNVRVVESADVPKTVVGGWFLADAKTRAREPIGARIIEMPEDTEQFENRDTHSRFVAYVPPGSIAKGKALATGVPGALLACTTCHGADLKGLAGIPPIVGRSPSYAVRQLLEFKTGARNGAAAAMMKPVVASMTLDEMIALAAYLASQAP
jgi:cytochrome c553